MINKTKNFRFRLCLLFFFLQTQSVFSADWPHWRGLNRDGTSNEVIKNIDWEKTPPKLLWRSQSGWAASNLAVTQEIVCTMGFSWQGKVSGKNLKGKTTVYCFDADDGALIWEKSFETTAPWTRGPEIGGPVSTPAIDGDRIYTIDRTGKLHCWNKKNGDILWQRDFSEERGMDWTAKQAGVKRNYTGFEVSPFIIDETLFINVGTHGALLNKMDGTSIWESPAGPQSHSTPTLYQDNNETMLALFAANAVKGIHLETGKVHWSYPWKTRNLHNGADVLVLPDNRFFFHSGYGKGGAMIQVISNQPKLLWEQKNAPHFLSMILHDGHAYGSGRCIRMSDGEVRYFQRGMEFAGTIQVGDKLLIQSAKGMLLLAESTPEEFSVISEFNPYKANDPRDELKKKQGGDLNSPMRKKGGRSSRSITHPIYANGKVYLRDCSGEVICLKL